MLPDGAVLAEWWRRLLARIVDWVIIYVVTLIVAFPWLGDAVRDGRLHRPRSRRCGVGETPPDPGAFAAALLGGVPDRDDREPRRDARLRGRSS